MENNRTLQLNIRSAKDLHNVNIFSKMKVYVVVSLSGGSNGGDTDKSLKAKTHVHVKGGSNPTWNFEVTFKFNELLAQQNRLFLEFTIFASRTIVRDAVVGTVHVPLRELLDDTVGTANSQNFRSVMYQVTRPSGKPSGTLSLSYKLGDTVSWMPPIVYHYPQMMVYPPPVPSSNHESFMTYPPPQYPVRYGYPPLSEMRYGYFPPQTGYGYPSQPGYHEYPPLGYPPSYAGNRSLLDEGSSNKKFEQGMRVDYLSQSSHGYPPLRYPTQSN